MKEIVHKMSPGTASTSQSDGQNLGSDTCSDEMVWLKNTITRGAHITKYACATKMRECIPTCVCVRQTVAKEKRKRNCAL